MYNLIWIKLTWSNHFQVYSLVSLSVLNKGPLKLAILVKYDIEVSYQKYTNAFL